jgi:hypothetical protein
MIDHVTAALRAQRLNFTTEAELQQGIAAALKVAGVIFEREVKLSSTDRIDFLLAYGLGIEVKVDGSISALLRQLHRYAQRPEIARLLVVSSLFRLNNLPAEINGKPVAIHIVSRAFA